MRGIVIIIAAVLVVGVGGLGWIGSRWFGLGRELVASAVSRELFDAQELGAPEAAVRAALPTPLTGILDTELYPGDPGRNGAPAGSSCVYFSVAPLGADGPELWRFCFLDGRLAEKSGQTIPG